MNTAEQTIDKDELLNLPPFNILSPELLDEVLASATIKRLPPGKKVFHAGDDDNEAVFLLSGQLALLSEGHPTTIIRAGSSDAKPVEDQNPRQSTALASTNVTLLSVDYTVLDKIIEKNLQATQEATKPLPISNELREEQILALPIFEHLSSNHKTKLSRHFSIVNFVKDDAIFKEGSRNDYYYIVSEGQILVTRRSPQSGQIVDITELGPNDGFGEESLIANGKHNATVTVKEDCVLFRLPRQEFMSLVIKPSIQWLTLNQAIAEQTMGAILLDVRMPSQFIANNISGSINLPLPVLRKTASILNNDREYIICSDNGIQSIIASFLLTYRGINTRTIKGPIQQTTTTV